MNPLCKGQATPYIKPSAFLTYVFSQMLGIVEYLCQCPFQIMLLSSQQFTADIFNRTFALVA